MKAFLHHLIQSNSLLIPRGKLVRRTHWWAAGEALAASATRSMTGSGRKYITQKGFLLACLIGSVWVPAAAHAWSYVLNTGTGNPLAPRGFYQQDPVLGNQWLAVQFSLTNPTPLINVKFFMNGEGLGGTGTFSLYSGAALPTPGTAVFSSPFTVPADFTDTWYGPDNLNLLLGAGTYWAAFQGTTNAMYASLLSGPASPAAGYASSDGTLAYTSMAGQIASNFGAQVIAYSSASAAYVFTNFVGTPGVLGSMDGTGSAALLNHPAGMAVDKAGNVFVADCFNHTIRMVTPAGVVTTLAGTAGILGSTDGTNSTALFSRPLSLAVDSLGNLIVADTMNHTIRKATPVGTNWVVTTLAGTPGIWGSADGTNGAARFWSPAGVTVDSADNIYVADTDNHTIRKVTPAGVVTTLAGSAGLLGSADGTNSAARFYFPTGVAVDSATNVYVADSGNNTIRKVTPAGVVTTLAGTAGIVGSADGTGSAAQFYSPYGVSVDSAGDVFVADSVNNTIRRITPTGAVTTVGGTAGISGTADGAGIAAQFSTPYSVVVDSAGNLYVGDEFNERISKGSLTYLAELLSPVPGSTLLGSNTTFTWSSGMNVSQYTLWIGSTPAGSDLYASVPGANLSQTVTLPVDGRTLYVRLFSQSGASSFFNDYVYTAYTPLGFGSLNPVLPSGLANGVYNQTLQASGGTGPYTWSWSGSTPRGLSMTPSGVLSGKPTAVGTFSFTISVIDAMGTVVSTNVSLTVQGQDLSYAMVRKAQYLWQTNTGAAVLPPASLDTAPFALAALVKQTPTGVVTSASAQLPDLTTHTLTPPIPLSQLASLSWQTNFATQAALDARATSGAYTFTITGTNDGTNTLPVSLTADNYPGSTPHISNWTAAQFMDPAAGFTLTWDALVGATTNDFVWVQIKNWVGGVPGSVAFETAAWGSAGALNGTNTSVVIPSGTLATNQTYCAEVAWCRFGPLDTATYPGAVGGSEYVHGTKFFINPPQPAQMLGPTNGTVLVSSSVTFNWGPGVGVSKFALWVGSAPGTYDLYAAMEPGRSRTLTMPATSAPVYVRLWSWVGGGWQFNNYSYMAPSPTKAVMLSPTNGTTNNSSSVTFTWNVGAGVSQYALWVGSTLGSYNLYAAMEPGTSRSLTLPVDGTPVYVRLWSLINGGWQYGDYSYRAFTAVKARFTTLTNGMTLSSTNVTLNWDAGAGVSQYALWVGSTPGSYDLYAAVEPGTSRTLTGLPADGRRLYVTLWSMINGQWKRNTYEFKSYTDPASLLARMLTPTNGTVLATASTNFTWSAGTGASAYAIWMGSVPGDYDVFADFANTNLTKQVSVPQDGGTLYVRLWTLVNGSWKGNDYVYGTGTGGATVKAAMSSPGNGTTLGGTSAAFTWSGGTGASAYALWVGTLPGSYDLYAAMEGANLTKTVTGLPSDGGPVYVRLWSLINGAWKFNDYLYTAALVP